MAKTVLKNKSLSKGLDAIFGEGLAATIQDIDKGNYDENQIVEIPLTKITTNPYQPRRTFDKVKIKELADSIKENGQLSPIVVKETQGGKYYIIAGERRFRANQLLGNKNIRGIVIDVTDKKMAELAIVENVQREDLNPIEEAYAIQQLIETHKMTQITAAKVLGKSRSYVANLLGLLKLDKKIIEGVLDGKVTYGQVKSLATLDKKTSLEFYARILNEKLTAREVENLAGAYKLREAKANKTKTKVKKDPNLLYVEDLLRNKVRSKVEVTDSKIIIKYKGTEQLNRILKRIDALGDED